MNLILHQPKSQSDLQSSFSIQVIRRLDNSYRYDIWRDIYERLPRRIELRSRKKLSDLKGKVKKISAEEIDKQIDSLRDEWQRDI